MSKPKKIKHFLISNKKGKISDIQDILQPWSVNSNLQSKVGIKLIHGLLLWWTQRKSDHKLYFTSYITWWHFSSTNLGPCWRKKIYLFYLSSPYKDLNMSVLANFHQPSFMLPLTSSWNNVGMHVFSIIGIDEDIYPNKKKGKNKEASSVNLVYLNTVCKFESFVKINLILVFVCHGVLHVYSC